ncbi:MAG TPA: prepilin-type N-terminal cleavage/methylation domain-containing protein [Gemmatimonadaceae bacterium]|nr:prepilin-type N-terminal cleavage/methylation domain-containing protein [Gemmatimonadaceae bacterium]
MHVSSASRPAFLLSPHPLRGFTLVELLIAIVVLTVGLLALTSAGAATVRLESRGQQLSRMASLGDTRLELLRTQRCAAVSGGAGGTRFTERWSVAPGSSRTRVIADSIVRNDGRATATVSYTFRSAVRC